MLIFKRRHAHVRAETLSEYLDGRLQESVAARVDRQVIACDACRQELESLRSTVSLLRQLPVAAPPRSFTLAGPPAQPVEARPSPLLKMPQWVYGAAASAAALVLAVLVSADATGLLARPDGIGAVAVVREMAAAAPAGPEVDLPERPGPATTAERIAPIEVVESLAAPAKKGVTTAVKKEAETGRAQAVPALEAAAPLAPLSEMPRGDASATPGPLPAQAFAAEPLPESRGPVTAEKEPVRQLDLAQERTPEETMAPAASPIVPQPPSQEAEPRASQEEATRGTAVVWRVVEGLAAAAGLAFLAGLFLKRRTLRRTARS